ncbi:MAG: sigma-70 family RNA polymerase sigma factor [Planctomycetes bacterium]|nr:sigma-70 family RNA polymerase sigma factor [Planctomycetota bacterium]
MLPTNRELFLAWRDRRKPADLATVFDRTAPELLRVALHLVGDAATAEDLVQGTFLTAMEKAHAFDGVRELEPWLVGILQQHAREVVRAARRRPDPERLLERVQELPDHALLERELSAELVRAIDRLDEPYRQTLLLRARHGLATADIAHVLGESPGTIRVRIHRGLELLKRALPAGVALGVLAVLEPARGLAAVKTAVLSRATEGAVLGAAGVGGAIVVKKLVVGAAVLVLALVLGWWLRNDSSAAREVRVPATRIEPERTARSPAAPMLERAEDMAGRAAVESSAPAERAIDPPVRGRVVDGVTGAPIAGARLALHAVQRLVLQDVDRLFPDESRGAFRAGAYPLDEWPWIGAPLSDLALAGRERVDVHAPPPAGTPPLAEVVTDAEGRFEMPPGTPWGFLTCAHEGYVERALPARRGEERYVYDGHTTRRRRVEHDSLVIRMWPWYELEGRVETSDGEDLEHELTLQFVGQSEAPPAERGGDPHAPSSEYEARSAGHWTVRTDAHGRFRARVGAARVQAHAVDPEWTLVTEGRDRADAAPRSYDLVVQLPSAKPVVLCAQRTPALRVVDATTRAPVRDFFLVSRSVLDADPFWTGRFHAPNGTLRLMEESLLLVPSGREGEAYELVVWADGYAPGKARLEDVKSPTTIELALEPGAAPELSGRVVERGAPIAGVVVTLVAVSRRGWSADESTLVDALETDAEGRFGFRAPAGTYVLRVVRGARKSSLSVALTDAGVRGFELDVGGGANLLVRVEGMDGNALAGREVVVTSAAGETRRAETDAGGVARLEGLQQGTYTAYAPLPATKGGALNVLQGRIELGSAGTHELTLRAPTAAPRHARLVVRGVDPGGWKARPAHSSAAPWTAVDSDGRIGIELHAGATVLDVESSAGRRWTFMVPEDAPDGFELVVELGGAGYAVRVVDAANGAPCAGWTVQVLARPEDGAEGAVRATTTDANGRFETEFTNGRRALFGLWKGSGSDGDAFTFDGVTNTAVFESNAPAALPRTELVIALPVDLVVRGPGARGVTLRGTVRRAGAPSERVWITATAETVIADGTLGVRLSTASTSSDSEGRFQLVHAPGERLRVRFWSLDDRNTFEPVLLGLGTAAAEWTHDFDLR